VGIQIPRKSVSNAPRTSREQSSDLDLIVPFSFATTLNPDR
jgi:hypothetical protein